MSQLDSLQYKSFEILSKETLTKKEVIFRLKGKINFEPGQFFQVSLPGYGEGSFAPCSNPTIRDYFEICVRDCGNLTKQLVSMLPGDCLDVRGPYGHGWPIGKLLGKNILILSGGIGLVPFRPLLDLILDNKSEFKKVSLIMGFKTDEHIIFKDDISMWQKKLSETRIHLEYGNSNLRSEVGLITKALEDLNIDKNTIVLICGPEIMREECQKLLLRKSVPENNIYISFERRVECGVGICQHCNIGKFMVCKDGPVFRLDTIKDEIGK